MALRSLARCDAPDQATCVRSAWTVERERDAAGTAREMVRADQQRHGLAALDHARHPQPRGERKRTHRRNRHVREVERHDAEVSGLQDERHRLERRQAAGRVVHAASTAAAADRDRHRRPTPDQSIAGIHQRHRFAPRHGGRPAPDEQRRPPGGTRPDDFRQVPARQPAAERRVDGRHPRFGPLFARLPPQRGRRQRDVELPGAQQGFEMGEGSHEEPMFRFMFASAVSISGPPSRDQALLVPSA